MYILTMRTEEVSLRKSNFWEFEILGLREMNPPPSLRYICIFWHYDYMKMDIYFWIFDYNKHEEENVFFEIL